MAARQQAWRRLGRCSGREIRLEHGDLSGLLVDKIGPARLSELLDRVAPLLDQRCDDLQHLRIVEVASLLDALVHDRSLEHAQRREPGRVLGFHRRSDVSADLFVQRHK